MIVVRTTCDDCGDVEVDAANIVLVLNYTGTGSYLVACPKCDDPISRPANERTASVLMASGVYTHRMAPPITEAEIDEFVRQLESL